jgi:hypothetical protein
MFYNHVNEYDEAVIDPFVVDAAADYNHDHRTEAAIGLRLSQPGST